MLTVVAVPLALAAMLLSLPPWSRWWGVLVILPLLWWWTAGRSYRGVWFAAAALATGLVIVVLFPVVPLAPAVVAWVWAVLVLGFAGFLYLSRRCLSVPSVVLPVWLGALWWLMEQGLHLAGVPWTLALHLVGDPQRLAAAAYVGQAGLSALWVMLSACLYLSLVSRHGTAVRRRAAGIGLVLAAMLILTAGLPEPAYRDGPRVAAVQTALEPVFIDQPGAPLAQRRLLGEIQSANASLLAAGIDDAVLVVWPESLLPMGPISERHHVAELVRDAPGRAVYHAYQPTWSGVESVMRSDALSPPGVQAKLRPLLGFEDTLTAGKQLSLMTWQGEKFLPLVCSDALMLGGSLGRLPTAQAAFAVVAVNDAYLSDSNLALLHLAHDILGAVQTGLPIVRSANGGVTAIISARGHVQSFIPLYDRGVAQAQLRLPLRKTFFSQYQVVVDGVWGLLALLAVWRSLGRSRSTPQVPFTWRHALPTLLVTLFVILGVHSQVSAWADAEYLAQRYPVKAPAPSWPLSGVAFVLGSYGLRPHSVAASYDDVADLRQALARHGLQLTSGDAAHPSAMAVYLKPRHMEAVVGVREDGLRRVMDLSTGKSSDVTATQWGRRDKGERYSIVPRAALRPPFNDAMVER